MHIIEQLADFGGGPRVLLNLAANHDRKKYRLIFVTYQSSALRDEVEKHGVEVLNLSTLSIVRLVIEMIKLVCQRKVDVIITHHTRPLLAGWLAAKMTGVPLIHHEHSSALYHNWRRRIIANWCLHSAGAIVCCSRHAARTIYNAYKPKLERIQVLYNPVEERKIIKERAVFRKEIGIGRDEFVIGHIGGMIGGRDQATLIKSFYRLHQRIQGLRLILIGDGPLRGQLEALTTGFGLRNDVLFVGYTDLVGDYLNAMDIYVNSALDEGFGIAVVEAMLAGKPVVLANAGSHPELIVDGEQGLFYKGGDAEALEKALAMLVENPTLRHRMAAAGKNAARARFSSDSFAEEYDNLIENLMKGKTTAFGRFVQSLQQFFVEKRCLKK